MKKKMSFELLLLLMIVLPPLAVCTLYSTEIRARKGVMIFLLAWVSMQWISLIDFGGNIVVGIVSANLSMLTFFLVNFYFSVDISGLSDEERALLYSYCLRLVVTISSFVIMLSIRSTVPDILYLVNLKGNIPLFWSKYRIMACVATTIAWGVFMTLDKYEALILFPKPAIGNNQLRRVTPKTITSIYFLYLILIFMFLTY